MESNNGSKPEKKTDAQIQEAIVLLMMLRGTMPKHSLFGDDNHLRIDVQIDALKGHGYKWNNTDFESLVMDVREWKNGENDSWLDDIKEDIENFK
jgi:hypothetical protein